MIPATYDEALRDLQTSPPGSPVRVVFAVARIRESARFWNEVVHGGGTDREGVDGAIAFVRATWPEPDPLPAWLADDGWQDRWRAACDQYGEAFDLR